MPMMIRTILIALLALSSWSASAQKQADLPRVLIIGDSNYSQPVRSVGGELKGKARVTYNGGPTDIVLNSTTALENLDFLLGKIEKNGKPVPKKNWPVWDLIHINVGLGDLVYRVPNLESFHVLPIHSGGVVTTEPKQYEKNLDELIRKLKATGAKVIWANTTPIRDSRSNVFVLGSEDEYNKIADRVMKKHRVPTNDMNAYARSIMNMDKPAPHGFDPFYFDKKSIHPPIVDAILKELGLKVPKREKQVASQ